MRITHCENYREMSIRAADLVMENLTRNPRLLFCASTGHSPAGLYEEMVVRYRTRPERFQQLRVLKLDEWGGLPHHHPVTCEHFLRQRLLEPLAITDERYFSFLSDAEVPDAECHKVQTILQQEGPIDVCILGLGKNGHLGFNEPARKLEANCHCTPLSEESLGHSMIDSLKVKPRFGITLGMDDILASKMIILLVTGNGKQDVVSELLRQKPTPALPASFLWTHENTECFLDRSTLA